MSKPTLLIPGNLVSSDYSPSQEELDKWVPLDYIMNWFDQRISETGSKLAEDISDRILILKSSTGSGKSTLIPPELFHLFQNKTNKIIACTQPRVLTAIEIPKNTIPPFHTREKLPSNREALIYGKNIGTQTGVFNKKINKGVVFMTPGVMVAQMNMMSNEEFMNKYSIIIIDEAHERSLQIDSLIYLIKKFIYTNIKNKECPFLVIMSATFDAFKFADYLIDLPKKQRYKNIIDVRGFTFPITEIFMEYDSQNYISTIVEKVEFIHANNPDDFTNNFRDILIFVKGAGEINKLKKKVSMLNTTNEFFIKYPVIVLGLTGEIVANQSPEYRDAIEKDISELKTFVEDVNGSYEPDNPDESYDIDPIDLYLLYKEGGFEFNKNNKKRKPGKFKNVFRRVIIATNVAETGITIETLKYVVEVGWVFSKEFNPCFNCDSLIAKPITQSMYKQRRGRVGRKAPGSCYCIYTKHTFESMQEDQYPDIVKSEITLDLLNMLIREVDPGNIVNNNSIIELLNNKEFWEEINKKKIDLTKLDLLDLPPPDSINYSLEKLYVLGAITSNSIPTILGFIMNKFRYISIESIKMILSGYAWKAAIIDLITIAAFIQFNRSNVITDENKYQEAKKNGIFNLFSLEIKSDLFISDTMIEYILIFNEFQKLLYNIGLSDNIINELKKWCDKYGLDATTLTEIIEIRDSVIKCMCIIGLNPFQYIENSMQYLIIASETDKLNYIKTLKQCIFEGFKLNLAVYNKKDRTYYTRKTNIGFQIPEIEANYIIYDTIFYNLNSASNLYEPNILHYSVMDGYVVIDNTFDKI